MQTLLDFETLSRTSDPSTSRSAARAIVASGQHESDCRRVLEAIRRHPGLSTREISEVTGIDRHLLGRRAADLKKRGLIRETAVRRQNNKRLGMALEAV
jgi:DNA-binding MarR family transcriptional regulator